MEVEKRADAEPVTSKDIKYVEVRLSEGVPTISIAPGQVFDREKLKDSISKVLGKYEFPTGRQRADFMQLYCSTFGFSTEEINPLMANTKAGLVDSLSELVDTVDDKLKQQAGNTVTEIGQVVQEGSLDSPGRKKSDPKFSLFLDEESKSDDLRVSDPEGEEDVDDDEDEEIAAGDF